MNPRALLEAVVRIPSVTGHETDVVAFLQQQARQDGLRVLEDEVGNLIAEAGQGEKLILFVGHVDTVAGDIPVRIEDDVLWGRGSVDAKGALVAAYCAARRLRDHPDLRIRVIGCVDEEGRSRGARALPRDLDPAAIIIGEPSGWDGVTLGYKGILRGQFRASRAVSHGGRGHASATDVAVSFWHAVQQRFHFRNRFGSIFGRLDGCGAVSDGLQDSAAFQFQLRLPPTIPPEAAEEELRQIAFLHEVELIVEESIPAALTDGRSGLAATFRSAIRAAGGSPRPLRKTGTADFNLLHQWYPDVPIVAYGPGDSSLDHAPDERLDLAEFERAVQVLQDAFSNVAGQKDTLLATRA